MNLLLKFLSVFCCVMLVVMPFSLTVASASGIEDAILFGIDIIQNWVSNKCDEVENMSCDEFANWYLSNSLDTTLFKLAGLMTPFAINCPADIYATNMLKAGQYQVATVNKDMLNKLKDSANGFLSDYYKDLRINTFEDFNLQTYDKVETQSGSWLGLSGSGSFVHYGISYDGSYYELFNKPSSGQISLYTGSNQAPWCMFVPSGSNLYQNGQKITNDANCWVLPLDYNTVAVMYYSNGSTLKFRWQSGSTINDVNFWFSGVSFGSNCKIYQNGEFKSNFDHISDFMSRYDFVSKLTNMINVRLTVSENDSPSYTPVSLPSDIPYDDNGDVVVCVPVAGSGGDIVYLTPTEYNTYVDNGYIINNDNSISDYYDDETVNNITNVYNNYVTNNNYNSNFDITELFNYLDIKFDEINENLKKLLDTEINLNVNIIPSTIDTPDKDYDNFSDCITANIPLISETRQLVSDFQECLTVQEPLSFEIKIFSISKTFDFSWYEPYREQMRNLLKVSAYIFGFGAMWTSVKSVFGVRGGAD